MLAVGAGERSVKQGARPASELQCSLGGGVGDTIGDTPSGVGARQ